MSKVQTVEKAPGLTTHPHQGDGSGGEPRPMPSPGVDGAVDSLSEVDKKRHGVYYTPSDAARILCAWAIQTADDRVLEPSFGACGFLVAAREQLDAVGAGTPRDRLYGCDIDPEAFSEFLEPKLGLSAGGGRFFHRDFLRVAPDEFEGGPFDVIVGNPPYVSYHNTDSDQREASERALSRSGFQTGPKSSLWASFLLYSTAFLKEGGRMAWLLPSSFLYAEYAAQVRDRVAERFDRSLVVQLGQRLFLSEGTEESTAVLLAEGYRPPPSDEDRRGTTKGEHSILIDFAETLSELEASIEAWEGGESVARPFVGRAATAYIGEHVEDAIDRAAGAGLAVTLGDLADVRIGIVTGANPFFVIDQERADECGLPDEVLRPILAKFAMVPGAELTCDDLADAREAGARLLLVDSNHSDLEVRGSPLRDYLASFPRAKRHANRTFTKRDLWHRPDDGRPPDAFFPYMYQHGPRIILNAVPTTSTNTIHRVYFKKLEEDLAPGALKARASLSDRGWMRACAVSILSTFSQLSGEIQGRAYGAGVLKHEPSEARRIRLILPPSLSEDHVDEAFHAADGALRDGEPERARRLADGFVLATMPMRVRDQTVSVLAAALDEARRRRHPFKRASTA